ncbi:MAG: F0F1 ATP synthase subunit B [bacterium]|nr:F0F1 ATP synthase subunit B [bacterium]
MSTAYTGETTKTTEVPGAEEGLLASLGINAQLFVFQLINFALVVCVIWFLILKPLTKKMAEREKIIDDSLDNAKRVQENLAKSEKEYQSKIDMAKAEANRILEKTNREAEAEAEAARIRAKAEIEKLVEQARKKIQNEKEEMSAALRGETADLVVLALEKIIGEKMTGEKDKKLIEESLKNLK